MIRQLTETLRINVKKDGNGLYIDTEKRSLFFWWSIIDRVEIRFTDSLPRKNGPPFYPMISCVSANTPPYSWNDEVWPISVFNLNERINSIIKEMNESNARHRFISERVNSML